MLKIVVADDEFLVIEGMKLLIKDVNIESEIVGYANDGLTAWETIQNTEPNVLITDIKMPGLSGLDLIKKCRERYPKMLFIIISGYQDFSYAQKAIGLGVIDYIDKPITPDKLESALHTAEDIYYKNILKNTHNQYLTHKLDELVRAQSSGKYDEMEKLYKNIKEQIHQEHMKLEDYKRYMYMLVTFVAGVHYDNGKKDTAEKHFPSYRNLYILQTYEEVDQYADYIILNIINRQRMEESGVMHGTIKDLLQYIQEHYHEDISLNELAERVKMNPVYLSSLFKEETGISYVKYLTDLRLQKAKTLLTEGYLVTEVSEMVGYHNYRYFCDIFKKNTGMTPNEYKGTIRKTH
ncbi:MAG: response regulator [bacterium]|nr:response regulator [bacterium]